MTINYGKRDPGGLTAASPGDTLYIPFATYNDSGASIGIGGTLAVTDIEIFKNGGAVARATDSGYSLISDTGQYGNLVGLHRFSIQIFNTSDDTGFFDAGSQYHVALDSITVDGRTVRFFPAVFELGAERANLVEIEGDTGAANVLGQFAGTKLASDGAIDTGTGAADTGILSNAVWNSTTAAHGDTGTFGEEIGGGISLEKIGGDTGAAQRLLAWAGTKLTDSGTFDTGTGQLQGAAASVDTGQVSNAVWNSLRSGHVTAGTFGEYVNADVIRLDGDTGFADRLGKHASVLSASGQIDTGTVAGGFIPANVRQVAGDTGAAVHLAQMSDEYDTGRLPAEATATVDTGAVSNAVWNSTRAAHVTAGTFGQHVVADVNLIDGDTGAATHLGQMADEHDTGRLQAEATATLDTGAVSNAVWNSTRAAHTIAGTLGQYVVANVDRIDDDTGAATHLAQLADEHDTGRLQAEATATLDTGAVSNAIWNSTRAAHTTAGTFGEYIPADVQLIDGDTGGADRLGKFASVKLTDSGTFDTGTGQLQGSSSLDTGVVNQAVWQANGVRALTTFAFDTGIASTTWSHATRTLTAFAFDTGVSSTVWSNATRTLTANTNLAGLSVNVDQLDGDTGAADVLGKFAENLSSSGQIDTGVLAGTQAGTIDANITYVNETAVTGTGDTGTGDTWRPA